MPRNNLLSHFHQVFFSISLLFKKEWIRGSEKEWERENTHISRIETIIRTYRKNVLCFQINHQHPSSERESQYLLDVEMKGEFKEDVIETLPEADSSSLLLVTRLKYYWQNILSNSISDCSLNFVIFIDISFSCWCFHNEFESTKAEKHLQKNGQQ